MNLIQEHLNKKSLHHAYLIEGVKEQVLPEVLEFVQSFGIETVGNADVSHIVLDSFKIEDARNLKSYAVEKGYTSSKKIFIISTNNFLLEAQNSLLKMFEEPIENTHFFLIVPDASALLQTFVSRFYVISPRSYLGEELKEAEKFVALSQRDRIDFIKELIAEAEAPTPEGVGVPTTSVGKDLSLDSARSKALKFLNTLETVLHQRLMSRGTLDIDYFRQIFKVREFLRQPGSSTKSLMESVALVIPVL